MGLFCNWSNIFVYECDFVSNNMHFRLDHIHVTHIHTQIHTYMHACMHKCAHAYIHTLIQAALHHWSYLTFDMHTYILHTHSLIHIHTHMSAEMHFLQPYSGLDCMILLQKAKWCGQMATHLHTGIYIVYVYACMHIYETTAQWCGHMTLLFIKVSHVCMYVRTYVCMHR